MEALNGIRVLDMSQFLSGPRCAQILALLGADVIKVESPAGDTMRLLMGLAGSERALSVLHQNKRSAMIDINNELGKEALIELVKRCDVLVENFAPGILKRRGLDSEALLAINPRLIYVSISGFGHSGPESQRTAFDIISQATAGIMYANHSEDTPPGVFFGDLCTGAFAAMSTLAALRLRDQTGQGQAIDVSMQDVMYFHNFWCQSHKANREAVGEMEGILGRPMEKLLSDHEHPMPFWNSFHVSDGYVVAVALTDAQWNRLLKVVGREDLLTDERFNNFIGRIRNADEGLAALAPWFAQRTVDEVIEQLSAERIPCGRVADYEHVNSDPQLEARGMFKRVDHERLGPIDVPNLPCGMDQGQAEVRTACPDLGADTEQILRELLDLDDAALDKLRASGAIP
ncbi:MAG: CoA transferase [Candidatus Alcyoniella australis]|nr:CoA transferase [Candidatus Alcyoniella australis]